MFIKRTIARPYANAAFMVARKQQRTAEWGSFLRELADLMRFPLMESVARNQTYRSDDVSMVVKDLMKLTDESMCNLIYLLTTRRRLLVCEDLFSCYWENMDEFDGRLRYSFTTAFPIADQQISRIIRGLQKKTGKRVVVCLEEDKTLISGVALQRKDKISEHTILSRLKKFQASLGARSSMP